MTLVDEVLRIVKTVQVKPVPYKSGYLTIYLRGFYNIGQRGEDRFVIFTGNFATSQEYLKGVNALSELNPDEMTHLVQNMNDSAGDLTDQISNMIPPNIEIDKPKGVADSLRLLTIVPHSEIANEEKAITDSHKGFGPRYSKTYELRTQQ